MPTQQGQEDGKAWQTHAIGGDFDPLASADERAAAAHREEARAGYFTGPGWAPTWHGEQ